MTELTYGVPFVVSAVTAVLGVFASAHAVQQKSVNSENARLLGGWKELIVKYETRIAALETELAEVREELGELREASSKREAELQREIDVLTTRLSVMQEVHAHLSAPEHGGSEK